MDVNSTFLNDPEHPTRQHLATDPFLSPDVTIIHAACKEKNYWERLDILLSDHHHNPPSNREAEGGKRLLWDCKKWDLATFTTADDEQLRGSGLRDGNSKVPIPRERGARFSPKTHQTEGSGDDRRVLEDTKNHKHREGTRRA